MARIASQVGQKETQPRYCSWLDAPSCMCSFGTGRGDCVDAHAESESYRRSNYRLICWWSTRVEVKGAEKHFTWFSLGNGFIVSAAAGRNKKGVG